ncbi:UNVERIFIED_CONTAM: protein yippee-like [Sesamum radiatum]|uniref:Protein yippee-like n=1 Tax=Sesamum radiatum TaxID=300843 RepID=A0AAW2TDL9_SESRA
MGRVFEVTLEGKIYSCKHCGTHLALAEEIVSKETAHEKSQKYKEGKSVLERFKISGPDGSQYWVSHGAHVGGSDADDA